MRFWPPGARRPSRSVSRALPGLFTRGPARVFHSPPSTLYFLPSTLSRSVRKPPVAFPAPWGPTLPATSAASAASAARRHDSSPAGWLVSSNHFPLLSTFYPLLSRAACGSPRLRFRPPGAQRSPQRQQRQQRQQRVAMTLHPRAGSCLPTTSLYSLLSTLYSLAQRAEAPGCDSAPWGPPLAASLQRREQVGSEK